MDGQLMNVFVLAHPEHGIGSDQCRAGEGMFACTPRKTHSGSGDVGSCWGDIYFTTLLGSVLDISVYIGLEYKIARARHWTELCQCDVNSMRELLLVSLQQYFQMNQVSASCHIRKEQVKIQY